MNLGVYDRDAIGGKPTFLRIVGAARFELATSWSRTKRTSQAASRPELQR